MEITIKAQRDRARQELRELQRAARDLEKDTIARAIAQLEILKQDLQSRFRRAGTWDRLNLRRLLAAVEETATAFERLAVGSVGQDVLEALRLGWKMTEAGGELIPRVMFTPPEFAVFSDFKTDLIRNVSQNIRFDVARIVRSALLTGRSLTETIEAIDHKVEQTYRSRSEAIARTETNRALVLGQTARIERVMKETPTLAAVTKKFWLHTDDNRVRPSHEKVGRETNPEYGGTPIDLNESFDVGTETANAPFDPGLSAGETINCRCRLSLTIQTFEGA